MWRLLRWFWIFQVLATPVRLRYTQNQRNARQSTTINIDDSILGCLSIRKFPGEYTFVSNHLNARKTCSLYIEGLSNQLIEIEFLEFDIACQGRDGSKGQLLVLDGWEHEYEVFPSAFDHSKSIRKRWKDFCGSKRPKTIFISEQNAAQVIFRTSDIGQGFKVRVTMPQNYQPCNVMTHFKEDLYTIQNYGKPINCSFFIRHPAKIQILSVDVGTTSKRINPLINSKCNSLRDYVEFRSGEGLDVAYMFRRLAFCGRRTKPFGVGVVLGCSNAAVRLVSSGFYMNSVTFSYTEPTKRELITYGSCKVQ